jgi:hypothetical protein
LWGKQKFSHHLKACTIAVYLLRCDEGGFAAKFTGGTEDALDTNKKAAEMPVSYFLATTYLIVSNSKME